MDHKNTTIGYLSPICLGGPMAAIFQENSIQNMNTSMIEIGSARNIGKVSITWSRNRFGTCWIVIVVSSSWKGRMLVSKFGRTGSRIICLGHNWCAFTAKIALLMFDWRQGLAGMRVDNPALLAAQAAYICFHCE